MPKSCGRQSKQQPEIGVLSRREIAYRHLLLRLTKGELPPGSLLSEITLANELNFSRTPVREAIGQLMTEGILEQLPYRGTIVRQLSRRDIVELYELREALEVYAAVKVTRQKLCPDTAVELKKLLAELERVEDALIKSGRQRLTPEEMLDFVNIDLKFHSLLVLASENSRLVKIIQETRLLIRIFALPHEGHDAAQLRSIRNYHTSILNALLGGDEEEVRRFLAGHIQVSLQERLESHDRWERWVSLDRVTAPY